MNTVSVISCILNLSTWFIIFEYIICSITLQQTDWLCTSAFLYRGDNFHSANHMIVCQA